MPTARPGDLLLLFVTSGANLSLLYYVDSKALDTLYIVSSLGRLKAALPFEVWPTRSSVRPFRSLRGKRCMLFAFAGALWESGVADVNAPVTVSRRPGGKDEQFLGTYLPSHQQSKTNRAPNLAPNSPIWKLVR